MYDDESKRMLREILETSKENNKLLKRMRRAALWGGVLRVIWWAIIIGVPIYLYFSVLQPVFNEVGISFSNILENIENLQEVVGKGVSNITDVVNVGEAGIMQEEAVE